MKNLMLFAFAISAICSQSHALEVQSLSAKLTKFNMDPAYGAQALFVSGNVKINSKSITLTMNHYGIQCVKAPCPQPTPVEFTLPLISVVHDGCGSIILTGPQHRLLFI